MQHSTRGPSVERDIATSHVTPREYKKFTRQVVLASLVGKSPEPRQPRSVVEIHSTSEQASPSGVESLLDDDDDELFQPLNVQYLPEGICSSIVNTGKESWWL